MNGNQLADHLGVTYRQVDHWTTNGYLRAREANPGHGNRRHYPPREVKVGRLMAALVTSGMDPQHAARLARRLTRTGSASLGGGITLEVGDVA